MRLTDEFRTKVRAQLDDALLSDLGNLAALKKRLHARLEELDAKEDQYLELVCTAGWPKYKIRRSSTASRPSGSRSRANWPT